MTSEAALTATTLHGSSRLAPLDYRKTCAPLCGAQSKVSTQGPAVAEEVMNAENMADYDTAILFIERASSINAFTLFDAKKNAVSPWLAPCQYRKPAPRWLWGAV